MSRYDERVALIREAYEAFNRRAIDAVLATLDPEVDWPNVLEGVTIHGHAAVREYWEKQFREIDPHVEPVKFFPRGDEIVVDVHQVVRDRSGRLLSDSHVAHAYSFNGDLVGKMTVYPSVEQARMV